MRTRASPAARQYLALNGVDVPAGANTTLPAPDMSAIEPAQAPRTLRIREWRHEGRAVARIVDVADLGHAWSGGDGALPFNDTLPPDATALLVDFATATAQ